MLLCNVIIIIIIIMVCMLYIIYIVLSIAWHGGWSVCDVDVLVCLVYRSMLLSLLPYKWGIISFLLDVRQWRKKRERERDSETERRTAEQIGWYLLRSNESVLSLIIIAMHNVRNVGMPICLWVYLYFLLSFPFHYIRVACPIGIIRPEYRWKIIAQILYV